MDALKEDQKVILAKARNLKRHSMDNPWYRRLYIDFINREYMSPEAFTRIVTGENVYPFERKTINKTPINQYIDTIENDVLGKAKAMEKING